VVVPLAAGATIVDMAMNVTRILIADDHPLMREGLRFALEREPDMQVVAEAADGEEALAQFEATLPDVTLMDLQMPRVDGLQALMNIRETHPGAAVVVLTTYPGDARIAHALEAGATSYILKTATHNEILTILRAAASGKSILGSTVSCALAEFAATENLSTRELSVLRLIAGGHQNRRIGERLHVSEQTVKTRIKSILAKLQAQDRTHAVSIARRRGFIDV
jgi:DNA-binding NarL/FixJ family response regulator